MIATDARKLSETSRSDIHGLACPNRGMFVKQAQAAMTAPRAVHTRVVRSNRAVYGATRREPGPVSWTTDPLKRGSRHPLTVRRYLVLGSPLRWKIERLSARLGNSRRLVIRYEHSLETSPMLHLACAASRSAVNEMEPNRSSSRTC